MQPPRIPDDEPARLAALHFLEILDTGAEERFDRVTDLARELLGVPICLVSLVDEDRQWFKSRQGLDATQTPREVSFCGHAILDDQTFVVEDAYIDERFADNPLVTGDPRVRFYAGHPLATQDGHRIGTLCVIDHDPRGMDDASRRILQRLAGIVQSELRSREALRRTALQLEEFNRRIHEGIEAKARFLAQMSHEIRTPMTSILGYVDLLDSENATGEDRRRYTKIVKSSGEHLLALVNDILDHSKVEAGRMQVERIEVSLPELLREVDQLMRVRAEEKGISLRTNNSGPVPSTIQTDPVRLRQILVNLVGNAIKFTDAGQVEVTASLHGTGDLQRLAVAVRDSGIGMDRDQMERIFEPFGQADGGVPRRFGGTGLGLTISRQLAQLLGGDIEVDSEFGVGSRFTLHIDPGALGDTQMLATLERSPRRREPNACVAEAQSLQGRVLVAEDDEVNRLLLRKILDSFGMESELVSDGRAAVTRALDSMQEGRAFDLVLMDMIMPVVDGYAATSQLRAAGYRHPVVALTGNTQDGDREICLRSGCDDFLTKPIDRKELFRVLARFLSVPC